MFREHVAIGAIVAMVFVVVVFFYALITDPFLLIILFVTTIVGSFLPDVDSDSGIPFYMVFGTATLGATGVVLLYTLAQEYGDWRYIVGIPAAAFVFFWVIVGSLVKKKTRHRGMFHSIPATIIAGAATLLIARHYGLSTLTAHVYGAGMAIGYLTHLVLDELHAGITLDGNPFTPKKSLGTALKLFADSNGVNIATYLMLTVLVYTALQP